MRASTWRPRRPASIGASCFSLLWWVSVGRIEELRRHLELHLEQDESERLAVAIEVERAVDAAVEHIVDHEVHRVELWQHIARHPAGATVRQGQRHARLRDLLDEEVEVRGI